MKTNYFEWIPISRRSLDFLEHAAAKDLAGISPVNKSSAQLDTSYSTPGKREPDRSGKDCVLSASSAASTGLLARFQSGHNSLTKYLNREDPM